MRMGRKVIVGFLMLCLMAPAKIPAKAAEEEYTYTVRFYAGAQGLIDGETALEYREVPYGERISFSQSRVSLKDNGKYYIRGIRESGRDNDTAVTTASFVVTEDADYVVSYGILSDSVMYTVEYVDGAGNALAPGETYYGNVGDRPVLAFIYIEGYQPQAYNLTGVLDRDASRNVFRFVYSPIPSGTVQETEGGQGAADQETGGGQGAADQEPGNGNAPEGEEIADETVPRAASEDLLDIHDEEIPKTDGGPMEGVVQPNGFAYFIGNLPTAGKLLIGLAAVAAVGAGWFFLLHKKRKEKG